MQDRKYLGRGLRLAATIVVICAALAATASGALADAGTYTARVTPGSVAASSSTPFVVTLTDTSATFPMNAAIVRPPKGFALTATSQPSANGNATLGSGQVVLKGIALHPGQSTSVTITATAPKSCQSGAWSTQAFVSSLQGTQLRLDNAHSRLTTACLVPADTQSCLGGSSCTATVTSTTATFSVTAGPSTSGSDGTLTAQVDPGNPLVCQGQTAIDSNWYGFLESTNSGATGDRSKTINYTIFDTSRSTAGVEVCFAAPYEFETLGDANAPRATMPDGKTLGYLGLLETCDGDDNVDPCVQSITTGFDTAITVTIPANEPGDPWMHG